MTVANDDDKSCEHRRRRDPLTVSPKFCFCRRPNPEREREREGKGRTPHTFLSALRPPLAHERPWPPAGTRPRLVDP